ncbi:helix-turn-helix domain-containing protein [Streptomyces triticiradicis]|uniref:helix-turn-helix domain-containing protein n=1 Tax=Streptomyces triticiradicis TaxID=2651189 RepID=UPI001CED08A4|nr:helix-turn-helix domain-containing protein [Streptomyces triticiradicis]
MTHVREYQPDQYTIVGNHLAQHRGLSAAAIGIAVHILSLPEGARVDIRSLAERFPEGRDRIACALRERLPSGRMVTRTYAFHAPALTRARREAEPETAAAPVASAAPAATVPAAQASPTIPDLAVLDLAVSGGPPSGVESATRTQAPEPAAARAEQESTCGEHRDKAEALLAGLRRTDIRLTLSGREVRRLAPLVVAWFENGLGRASVIHALTDDLPLHVRHPAGFLRNRLLDLLPPALPPLPGAGESEPLPSRPLPPPPAMATCEGGCDRGFRAPFPGAWCRDCRAARPGEAPVAPAGVTALV